MDETERPHSEPDATLDPTTPGSSSGARAPLEIKTIGPYVLLKKLGEGGMGLVWLAEQTAPVRRKVALKLIRSGLYDDSVLQRFHSEQQSLAVMNHPAIAKVFDAGTAPDGQPYFVMEYVDGPAITRYCDNKKLKIRDRLALFIQVCEGVQHAHQKAIIHRDLKPSNVLVAELDGKPVPRIIDFGIAKAVTSQTTPDLTLFTQAGALVGTPGFMSPEQASGLADVDTRTDVYSLGVILYVLLTGTLPFDTDQWNKRPIDEVLRQIREDDPPSPSTRLSIANDTTQTAAEQRGTAPAELKRLLHGDLDWITMRAVERDRARRYGTPSELAADIQRYLHNEPVLARPASTAYRLQKYVRRHRIGVAISAAAALLLVAFAIIQAIQLRRTTRERDRANRITDFMTGMFKLSDPSEARGNSITAREVLDQASAGIDSSLARDPELRARLMSTMGKVYLSLGLDSRAQSLFESALQLQRNTLGPTDIQTLETAASLATTLRFRGHYPEAEKLERETIDAQRRALGPNHPDTLDSLSDLGATLYREGRFADAEQLQRQTLDTQRRVLGRQSPATLTTLRDLGATLRSQGRYADAETLLREVLDIQTHVLGPDHPDTLRAKTSLANTLLYQAHLPEADTLYRQILDTDRRINGPEHPDTLIAMGNLANELSEAGHYPEAIELQQKTLDIDTRVLGPDHPQTILAMLNLSFTLGYDNRFADAENLQRQVISNGSRVLGPEHHDVLQAINGLAGNLQSQGHFPEAEKLERQALEIERRTLGPDRPDTLESMDKLGTTLQSEGHFADAEKLQRETLEIVSRVFGPTHPNTLSVMSNLGETLDQEGHYAEAEKLQRTAFDNVKKLYGPDAPQTIGVTQSLATTLSYEKRYSDAKPLFEQALQTAQKLKLPDGVSNGWYAYACGAALAGHSEDALAHLHRAVDAGFSDATQLTTDKQLKSLRPNPQFQSLVAQLRKHHTAAN